MQVDALAIDGAFRFTPKLFGDERGAFSEQFKAPIVREAIGHDFELAQVNCSSSTPGVVRGIHYWGSSAMVLLATGSDQVTGNTAAFGSLFFVGLLLFLVTLILNVLGDAFVRRARQRY